MDQEQLDRYHRQLLLKELTESGQEKLLNSSVLIIGAGGLGSASAYYLVAAGIGTVGIIDDDTVNLSNLQRQILHTTNDIGKLKVVSAKEKLNALNPDITINAHQDRVTEANINKYLEAYDFIIDATDNFDSKFLINDACIQLGKAYSHGGIYGFSGQCLTYVPGSTCYRCVFSEPPTIASETLPVLGMVAGMIGTIQATEAIKYLLNIGELLTNRLLTIQALSMDIRIVDFSPNKTCPTCSKS